MFPHEAFQQVKTKRDVTRANKVGSVTLHSDSLQTTKLDLQLEPVTRVLKIGTSLGVRQ